MNKYYFEDTAASYLKILEFGLNELIAIINRRLRFDPVTQAIY
jgi:hypothetical protein